MKALMPFVPLLLSVMAIMMYTSAMPPPEMNIFEPFSTHSSPSSTALVWVPAASVPAFGSVRPKAPSFFPDRRSGRYFFFCSSVPYVYMGQQHRALWVWIITPWEASVLEISSMAMMYVM